MKKLLSRMWRETDGVLSFEWTMLTSLLTVGVVSGIASVRDAVTDEMGDVAQAMVSLDQSYVIQPPLLISVHATRGGLAGNSFASFTGGASSSASDSVFIDASSYASYAGDVRGRMKVIELPRRNDATREAPPIDPEETQPAL